jgi:hypothetical protein
MRVRLPAQEIQTQEATMNQRLLGSIFRLRRLAQKFNHFWSYAVHLEDLTELFLTSSEFSEFQKKLAELCGDQNISPIGGRYLEDARFEDGWLSASFGGNDQLKVSINPHTLQIVVEYINGARAARAVYNAENGKLTWDVFPQCARDAVRILHCIAVLDEIEPRGFTRAYLPEELAGREAELYLNAPTWAHLWVNPDDLKDILEPKPWVRAVEIPVEE